MASGDKYVNLELKRFLSQNRMSGNFLDYLKNISFDTASRIFPTAGLFTYPITISTDSSGTFTLTPDPIEAIDDQGHVLSLAGNDLLDIAFENITSSEYWVGLHYVEIPSGIYNNPRTGLPAYDLWEESVGESTIPDSVVSSGGGSTITLNVNSLFNEPSGGVDYSGRVVKVWLNTPVSSDDAVAVEDVTVAYSSPNNTITTTATLGQSSVSTNAADYTVAYVGPTVIKDATNPFDTTYALVGSITGHSVSTPGTDIGDQLDLSGGGGHSLQKAYDGSAGSGSERFVVVNDGAITLKQTNDTFREHDILHAALRSITNDDTGVPDMTFASPKEYEVGFDIPSRFLNTGAIVHRKSLSDLSGNDYLQSEEDIIIKVASTNTIQLERVGADATFNSGSEHNQLCALIDMAEISGSDVDTNNGVYYIHSVPAADEVRLVEIDTTTDPGFTQDLTGTIKVRFFRPSYFGEYGAGLRIYGAQDFWRETVLGATAKDYLASLQVTVPDNTLSTQPIAVFARLANYSGSTITDSVHILANGNIVSTGDISAVNVTASTGDIVATAGNITAGGYIGATGAISATNGPISCVIGDIIAVGGDIEAQNGSVIADVFTYNDTQTLSKPIQLATGIPDSNNTTTWDFNVTTWSVTGPGSGDDFISFPIQGLPIGSVITGYEVIWLVDVIGEAKVNLYRMTHDFTGTPDATTSTPIGTELTSVGTSREYIARSGLTEATTTDRTHILRVQIGNAGIAVHGLRVNYTLDNLVGNCT